ncbi:MAG: hypothetical protein GOV01_01330 [Candidatus Altiarchaeota archaeon]|nr:hypothetical protein [Candidatus Altiarchaeota archaeon]
MKDLEKLAKFDKKLAMLALVTAEGIKPVSKIDSFDGPEEIVQHLLEDMGLCVEIKKQGCRSDILFGKASSIRKYHEANELRGKERVYALGIAFGYPDCCSKYFSEFLLGEKDEKPEKLSPLEHFSCPNCKVSPSLRKKYQETMDLFI